VVNGESDSILNSSFTTQHSPLYLQVFLTRLPVGCAEAARLQALQHAKRLVDRPSDVQVVNDGILQDALWVDDKQPAKSNVRFLDQDVVFSRESSANIRRERIF